MSLPRRLSGLIADLESEQEDVRQAAVIRLGQLSDPRLLPWFERLASDPAVSVRYFARRAIGDIRQLETPIDPPDADKIDVPRITAMIDSPEVQTRISGSLMCVRRRDPAILRALVERLKIETNPRVVATLVRAIASQGDASMGARLVKLLEAADGRVRGNVIEALTFFNDPVTYAAIERFAADDDHRVRAAVALALARWEPERVKVVVREMLESGLVWMKDGAIYVLRTIAAPWCLAELERLHETEARGELSDKIKAALREVREAQLGIPAIPPAAPVSPPSRPGSTAGLPAGAAARGPTLHTDLTRACPEIRSWGEYERLIGSANPMDRIHALQNIDLFEPAAVGPQILRLLRSETNGRVQATLARAAGRLGGPSAIPALAQFLRSPDARVRANAVEALGAIGTEAAFALLEDARGDADARVCSNLAIVMARRDEGRALEDLKRMILAEDHRSTESALHALARIGLPGCVQILELALARQDSSVGQRAYEVLCSLARTNPAAREIVDRHSEGGRAEVARARKRAELLERMTDPRQEVRLGALEGLASFDDEVALSRIEQAMSEPDPVVSQRAASLLRGILEPKEGKALLQHLGRVALRLHHSEGLPGLGLERLFAEARDLAFQLNRGAQASVTAALLLTRLESIGRAVLDLNLSGRLASSVLREESEKVRLRIPSSY